MVLPPHPTRQEPSAAVRQLWSDYGEWLMALPYPLRDDEPHDDSWERFMHERRKAREKARLCGVEERRKAQRQAESARREQQYQDALQAAIPWAVAELARRKRSQQRKAARGQPAGRPIDPQSKRQQNLAASAARRTQRLQEEDRQRQHQLVWQPRMQELAAMGITRKEVRHHGVCTDMYYDVPRGVKPPEWMLLGDHGTLQWRVYDTCGRNVVKCGPKRDASGKWVASGWD